MGRVPSSCSAAAQLVTHSGGTFVNSAPLQAGNTRSRCSLPRPNSAERNR